MPKTSVIVPVYKVEKYLHECVDSILAQTYTDFELILVDDGSPDNCGAICDEYAAKDSRVRCVHQENQGLSGARNSGIDVAQGEFITFVDSDDMIRENYLDALIYGMRDDVDIAACKYQSFEDGMDEFSQLDSLHAEYRDIDPVSMVLAMNNSTPGISVSACQKLYRASLVGNHRFPIGRIHEDQYLIPAICYQARRISLYSAPLYLYRVRDDSIVHRKFTLKQYDAIAAIDYGIQYFREREESSIVRVLESKRTYRIATYTILAYRDKVKVPAEYQISLPKALRRLRKMTDDNYFQYYLAQLHPKLPVLHAYWVKIKRILHITK